jgi:hypothetical protein
MPWRVGIVPVPPDLPAHHDPDRVRLFNDDTPIGWTITAAYAATVFASAAASRRDPRPRFWTAVTVVIALLGVNKQLDLQTPFLHYGHELLAAAGLWADRRVFRLLLLVLLVGGGAAFIVFTRRLVGRAWQTYVEALAGLAGLAAFVVMRAAAFNHLGRDFGGRALSSVTVAAALELGSVLLVLVGATRVWLSGNAGRR